MGSLCIDYSNDTMAIGLAFIISCLISPLFNSLIPKKVFKDLFDQ